MEKVFHSCEIYNKRSLSPIGNKKILYGENFKDKISLKRIFLKNFKELLPNENIKKHTNRTINQPKENYKVTKRFENNFTKYIQNVL
jgi:predicted ATP-dependent Lon-type protease